MKKDDIINKFWPKPHQCSIPNIPVMKEAIGKMMDEYLIEIATLKQLSKIAVVPYSTLYKRVKKHGWDKLTAISTPQTTTGAYKKILKQNGNIG